MMLTILRNEIRRLRQEESGVALMLTLSVILLLYVLCAGVYAMGETVRQKIELQNACDSAAYSAAVAQADGLSRMAMINRAMSWTYVKLTNMQIDYITYKWLELVLKRFDKDKDMCGEFVKASFSGSYSPFSWLLLDPLYFEEKCDANPNMDDEGVGWFCGSVGAGMDYVRLNNAKEPTPINVLRSDIVENAEIKKVISQYKEMIPSMKVALQGHYNNLVVCINEMNKSIMQTAAAVLFENLPRKGDGELDSVLGRDFIGYAHHDGAGNPYEYDEEGIMGYFSPLYNTELDERIFLSMADGEVYDDLADYFGSSGDGEKRFGGLDQWFVRSYAGEAVADAPVVEQKLDSLRENSLRALGICRVYKNTNLDRGLKVYRDHHHALGDKDGQPSCINTHASCPEQCHKVDDSVALYADYEWSSGQYDCACSHIHHWRITWKKGIPTIEEVRDVHVHKCESTFLAACDPPPDGHRCGVGAGVSHSRGNYFSCVGHDKSLKIPYMDSIPWTPIPIIGISLDHDGNFGFDGGGEVLGISLPSFGLDAFGGMLGSFLPAGENPLNFLCEKDWKLTEKIVKYSNCYKPNGFARIYGDDQEIFDEKYYCGEVARPFVLNASFYGKRGAIVVGLARRQRNPWAMLLNELTSVVGTNKSDEDGIYSAFNPVDNGYLVAFSASRAAHRFHPSDMARAKADEVGYPILAIADDGEYETRYDAVCDDEDGGSEKWGDAYGRFTVKNDVQDYSKMRVGCVCNDGSKEGRENTARFARCWNLCETDWDATLLPLRFALAEPRGECYDSFGHDVGDERRIGNVTWQDAGTDDEGFNPFERAAKDQFWFRFFTSSGERQHYDESMVESGQFLTLNAPGRVIRGNDEMYDLPYSTEDPSTKLVIPRAVRPKTDGVLDLKTAIKIRVL